MATTYKYKYKYMIYIYEHEDINICLLTYAASKICIDINMSAVIVHSVSGNNSSSVNYSLYVTGWGRGSTSMSFPTCMSYSILQVHLYPTILCWCSQLPPLPDPSAAPHLQLWVRGGDEEEEEVVVGKGGSRVVWPFYSMDISTADRAEQVRNKETAAAKACESMNIHRRTIV